MIDYRLGGDEHLSPPFLKINNGSIITNFYGCNLNSYSLKIKRREMNIAYTVTPPQQPTEQEWMREFKVGIQAPKFDNRAMDMNNQYDYSSKGFLDILERLLYSN